MCETPLTVAYTHIGGSSGDLKTVEHLLRVMETAGIKCQCEGSVLFSFFVERGKESAGIELLRAEKAKGWYILLKGERPDRSRRRD